MDAWGYEYYLLVLKVSLTSKQLHDHTQPKYFKFIRNASGKCRMLYQNYFHMPWEGDCCYFKGTATVF